jgi:Protein of unknown function (DUF4238)
MAGRRHHFIPRFLQEGFASHRTGDEVFTWVYRKGHPSFNTNITNVAVEGSFYSEGDDSEVDDRITDAESEFSELVRQLRTMTPGHVSDPRLAVFIAHLEVRTRHVRQAFLRLGGYAVSAVTDLIADEGVLLQILERHYLQNPSAIRESILKVAAEQQFPPALLETALGLAPVLLPQIMRQLIPSVLSNYIASVRQQLPQHLTKAVRRSHIRALKNTIAPEKRAQQYQPLNYFVVDESTSRFILGDSVVLFNIEGPRQYRAFLDKDDRINNVFVPVSSARVVVGTHGAAAFIPPDLCTHVAHCSMEHFIAAHSSVTNEELKEQIGQAAQFLTMAEMEAIASDLMRDLLSGNLDLGA